MNTYRRGRAIALVPLACALLAVLSGCGVTPVPADQVASTIVTQLKGQNVTVDDNKVTCPGELKPEVGQTLRCTFTAGGQPVDAVAKVSSVDGSSINFDITTEAKPVPQDVLANVTSAQLVKAGLQVEKVTCAGDLQPMVGQTQACTANIGGDEQKLTTKVTQVRGGLVNFSIEPAA